MAKSIPKHWPKHFNANNAPCDMIGFPCSCGAWHKESEDWVADAIIKYGWTEQATSTKLQWPTNPQVV